MRACHVCQEVKELSEFGNHKKSKDGKRLECRSCQKVYYVINKAKYKERYEQKRIELIAYQKEWNRIHRSQIRAWKTRAASRIWASACNRYTAAVTKKCAQLYVFTDLLGATKTEFIEYLMSRFTEGMTLENYGEWEMDHIYPLYSFDFHIEYEQILCFHYSNIQPMWKDDHIAKGMDLPKLCPKMD